MKLITRKLPNNFNLFIFGDDHEGSVLSSKKGWNKLIDLMHSTYDGCAANYGVDGGDPIEAIMIDDSRFSQEKLAEALPLEQVAAAVEKRQPIKDRMLYMLDSNHPRKLWRFGDLTAEICKRLGIEYGTYTAKLSAVDSKGGLMFKMYHTHGFKTINSTADDPKRREANKQLTLKRHLKFKAGDCVVMVKHHAHKLLVCRPDKELYLTDDGKHISQAYTAWQQNASYIHPDGRWYGCAGSFLRLFGHNISGYAEIFEHDPVELGFLILKVRDKKIVDLEPYYITL